MQAGFFETDITPAIGMEKPGGYGKAHVASIRDPLKVRAAVIADGETRVALVGIDSLGVQPRMMPAIRGGILRRCGIPASSVLVAASHTHSGGPFWGLLPEDYADAPAPVRDLIVNHSTIADPDYCGHVARQIVTAVCEADRTKRDAVFSAGRGREETVAFNRRFRMADGRTYTHPGKGNPHICEPAGPADPDVTVVSAWEPGGRFLGCIVNFACHGTTMWGGVSADWIFFLERTVRGAMGSDAVVVFLNGACGDVTQVDNLSGCPLETGESASAKVGIRVGAEACKVMAGAVRGNLLPLASARTVLDIGRRSVGAGAYESSLRVLQCARPDGRATEWTFAKEKVIASWLGEKQPPAQVEVQAIQVGPVVYLANPAEYFCALGLSIKRRSPFPLTCIVELANGCVGYVPDEDAFSPSGGGYETVFTSYSNLNPAAGRLIADESVRLARSFTPGTMPEPPAAPPFTEPWDYGIFGPDV